MTKKIKLEELKPGTYISGLEKEDSANTLFFINNILVKSEGDINRFLSNGYRWAYAVYNDEEEKPLPLTPAVDEIEEKEPFDAGLPDECEGAAIIEEVIKESEALEVETAEAADVEEESIEPEAEVTHPSPKKEAPTEVSFDEEIKEAKRIRNEAEGLVREFMHSVRIGEGIDSEKVQDTVGKMVDSVFRNQDALTSLARLKSFDDYTFAHSVNVCILSITLGRHMGLDKESIESLGVGAILHDIGKMLIPESILKKPGRVTVEEFEVIKKHPTLGAEILNDTKEIKEDSRAVALSHHERFDGTGYNRKLIGDKIHLFARIAAVADTYDAMTSNRIYQKGLVPEEAMKRMYQLRGQQFEPELVERLIKCLGIYPIGTLIELNTGELAVVRMPNHTHPLQPHILMLFDKDKKPFPSPQGVDLKHEVGKWIIASRDPHSLGILINELIA